MLSAVCFCPVGGAGVSGGSVLALVFCFLLFFFCGLCGPSSLALSFSLGVPPPTLASCQGAGGGCVCKDPSCSTIQASVASNGSSKFVKLCASPLLPLL